MATPTSHPHPQKQPAASQHTPASASSPPAPPSSHSGTNRSIPSPAYSAALKAPQRPLHHRNGSVPYGGTPRHLQSNGTPRPGTTSAAESPAATAAAAMLMDSHFGFSTGPTGFTPRGVGLTPVAMQMTASQGGISAIVAAHDQEEERKRRTEVIVGMMSARWGFVSQEGVERCARRLGLECLWEEGMGEERKRTLTIAGDGVLVDVEFRGEGVKGVVLQFEGSSEGVVAGAGAAGEVLGRDLKGDGRTGYVTLDRFVANLERLGTMDRLGRAEINCFDAVDGIFRCLDKVFCWEMGGEQGEVSKQRGKRIGSTEVMCRRSGRPMMHTKGQVGLSLQYWMERRLVDGEQSTPEDNDAMDAESNAPTEDVDESSLCSAIIECEGSPAELYPSIRISDAWISETIGKQASTETTVSEDIIDWQDPPPTFLAPKSPADGVDPLDMNSNTQPRAPDIRFVAKFVPPIIVPLQIAIQIHISVGSPLTQESLLPTTYESLVFSDTDEQENLPTAPRTIERTVISYDPTSDTFSSHKHKSTLLTQPNDYARAITDLPFSHPRQIIALLPTLRQWALTASILRRTFAKDPLSDSPTPISNSNTHAEPQSPEEPPQFQTIDDELADFLSSPLPSDPSPNTTNTAGNTRTIDITLTTAPLPRFNIHFPNPRHGGKLASVGFSVGLNGVIEAVDVDDGGPPRQPNEAANDGMVENGDEKGRESVRLREAVKRVLEIGESVCVCVEWVCGRS